MLSVVGAGLMEGEHGGYVSTKLGRMAVESSGMVRYVQVHKQPTEY